MRFYVVRLIVLPTPREYRGYILLFIREFYYNESQRQCWPLVGSSNTSRDRLDSASCASSPSPGIKLRRISWGARCSKLSLSPHLVESVVYTCWGLAFFEFCRVLRNSGWVSFPLLLPSPASKISIWTINCSTLSNNSVIEFGAENAKDLLSGAYVVPFSSADAANLTGRSLTSCVAILNRSIYCFRDSFRFCRRLIKYLTLFFFGR